jgi:prevent-host-death family protein
LFPYLFPYQLSPRRISLRSFAHITIKIVVKQENAMNVIAAGEFKAKCLRFLDEVNKTRGPVTVTKRGKPVARVVPIPAESGRCYGIID